MKLNSLRDVFVDLVRDLYSAETQLVKALPKMAKASTAEQLREAFESHLEETQGHVERLEQICRKLDIKAKGKTCQAMKGLVEEGGDVIEADGEGSARDAALIAAAQKVEHYEIAGYGTARTFAQLLGEDEAAGLLEETLNEEGAADKKLTEIAESSVNEQATEEESDEDEDEVEEEEGEAAEGDGQMKSRTARAGSR
jgi:ferritin-like metal-binding protein YciE